MEKLSLKELAVPIIKSIDIFNYLLKSHHRRTAIISYYIGKEMGLEHEDIVYLIIGAAMHDIGALSIQERDSLIIEDVENPEPHCIMGYRMLKSFDIFKDIAQIVRYHHVNFEKALNSKYRDRILLQSYIIHLADRIDILISPNKFILDQKKEVIEKVKKKSGTIFDPKIVNAFLEVSKAEIFWIDINNMTMEQLFEKIDFCIDLELDTSKIIEFSQIISKIVDFRSSYTFAHSYTVATLASKLGEYFNQSKETCNKLLITGYLHDIGKIGIDPTIIEKHGKLTKEEYNQIKLHSYYTGQILEVLGHSALFSDIVRWSKQHHERIDGSGYPFALSGDDIDLGTKIICYADIISALMENRPYRKSLPINKTFEILENDIAEKISIPMFNVLQEHKSEIEELILDCQASKFEEYKEKIIGQIYL